MITETALRISKLTNLEDIKAELRTYAMAVIAAYQKNQMQPRHVVIQDRKQGIEERQRQKSQSYRLLKHLIEFGKITNVSANNLYKIQRIASRVHDLRRAGCNIACSRVKDGTYEYKLVGYKKSKTA